MKKKTLISISKKTFIQVISLLVSLLVFSIILTYIVPKGTFGTMSDGNTDYLSYIPRSDVKGINLVRGIFAPVLVFLSSDGLTLIMLSLFLFVISASFQVMNDAGGIRAIVESVSGRFRHRRKALLVIISFLFYCFGAFLGLFEEMLTMLPIVVALCISVGFDSFTGFICSILACGFGFAGAITNPFTVLLASEIIGVNPLVNIWFRILIFIVMFGLLMLFLFKYTKTIAKDVETEGQIEQEDNPADSRKLRRIYSVFLLAALAMIVVVSLISSVRSYAVVILTAYFLIFGLVAGILATGSVRSAFSSFARGIGGALPTIVFIAFAASIKFVFEEGAIMPTVVHQINNLVQGKSPVTVALAIYLIVLLLEFFISSSTAKAILVMGILAMANTGLSKEMLVLLYTFGDGYTNVIFPTSPVLLISLSMIEMDYFKWIKKGAPLFAANLLLVVAFIVLGVLIGY